MRKNKPLISLKVLDLPTNTTPPMALTGLSYLTLESPYLRRRSRDIREQTVSQSDSSTNRRLYLIPCVTIKEWVLVKETNDCLLGLKRTYLFHRSQSTTEFQPNSVRPRKTRKNGL